MFNSIKVFTVFVLISLCFTTIYSQSKLTISGNSEVTIDGTSTLHDWTSKSTKMNGEGTVTLDGNVINEVSKFNFSIPTKSIESGKSKMDGYTYKALKADEFPNISFEMTSCTPEEKSLLVNGMLTIAGKSKEITADVEYEVTNGSIIFQCSELINMKDWDIEPPTLFMGTLKTGENVIVSFKFRCTL